VILPKRNQHDLSEVPAEVRDALEWRWAEHMDEVLATALVDRAVRTAISERHAEAQRSQERLAAKPA
jgi:ATP-dependent Lon protease